MIKILIKCIAIFSLMLAQMVFASIAVVVNPENTNELNERQVRNIFLGKTKTFPDGSSVDKYDLPETAAIREDFNMKVLRKTSSNLNSYWARMLFSSKGRPPVVLDSADDVKKMVASDKNAIGYIDADKVDDSVRVIMVIK